MGHTTTNRGLAATGTMGLVVGQCLGRGNTTIHVRVYYLISLGVRSTTAAGLTGGSVANRTIAVPEVIDDFIAIYWNDALHWLKTDNRKLTHYRLDIEDHEHPIITNIQIPQRGMNFLQSYGYMDPLQILMQIPYLLHLEGNLFQSCGCFLLVCRVDIGSSKFNIYEMMKGCYVWSVRYRVDTDDFMTPLLEGWSIWSTVWRIVIGEREEDYLLMINLSGKVVQYNLISKTLHDIFYCGSNQLDDNHDDDDDNDDELLQQLEVEHNIYEFIPSFARV
ncbi:hypothetical protein Tco_0378265 [Tanacetum coccineum]